MAQLMFAGVIDCLLLIVKITEDVSILIACQNGIDIIYRDILRLMSTVQGYFAISSRPLPQRVHIWKEVGAYFFLINPMLEGIRT